MARMARGQLLDDKPAAADDGGATDDDSPSEDDHGASDSACTKSTTCAGRPTSLIHTQPQPDTQPRTHTNTHTVSETRSSHATTAAPRTQSSDRAGARRRPQGTTPPPPNGHGGRAPLRGGHSCAAVDDVPLHPCSPPHRPRHRCQAAATARCGAWVWLAAEAGGCRGGVYHDRHASSVVRSCHASQVATERRRQHQPHSRASTLHVEPRRPCFDE